MKSSGNNVLVALMNNKRDFEIALKEGWYRIPVKSAPPIVKNKGIAYLAFYHTKDFEQDAFTIKWFAEVKRVLIVKRKDLLPTLTYDPKAEQDYYKIEFSGLLPLPKPIISTRKRRLLFIPTTSAKFFNATEVNHLFNDSPLEDLMWVKFMEKEINAERQYYIEIAERKFVLDFAVFCKQRNIDVECNGFNYHGNKDAIQKDKNRNNLLESAGWSVLRFTTDDIRENLNNTTDLVCETINKYGGLMPLNAKDEYRYVQRNDDTQGRLFG